MNIERIRAALDQPFGPLKCAESELRELLAENDRLRAAVQHESDCVEAAKIVRRQEAA